MEAVFISDIHLRSLDERNGQILLRFLYDLSASPKPVKIFLLGDIFDLWVGGHQVFVRRYHKLIEVLKKLKSQGCEIYYFEGNHDLHLENFWSEELGALVYTKPEVFSLGQYKVRCEHGDEMNLDDLAYLRLRRFLRSQIIKKTLVNLPEWLVDQIGNKWSQHSRSKSSYSIDEDRILKIIRDHAVRAAKNDNFDIIISGHMHVKDDWIFNIGEKKIRSINLGSWFQTPSVLVYEKQEFCWRSL